MNYNVIWNLDDINNSRNVILVDLCNKNPRYDMKCNQCLTFLGAYEKPEDINTNFCPKCGQKIRRQ